MTGEEIYNEILKKRDYSGSKDDEYAQEVETMRFRIDYDQLNTFYKLLEEAKSKGKKIAYKSPYEDNVNYDEMDVENIIIK